MSEARVGAAGGSVVASSRRRVGVGLRVGARGRRVVSVVLVVVLGWGCVVGAQEPSPAGFGDVSGLRFAYHVDTESGREVWVADGDGSGAFKVADGWSWWGWSPDGLRFAYRVDTESGGEAWMADGDGLGAVMLTDAGWSWWGWSPDGLRFAYNVYTESGREVWMADGDGSGAFKVADGEFVQWSPA